MSFNPHSRNMTADGTQKGKNINALRYNKRGAKTSWDDVSIRGRVFYILDRGGLPDVDAPWIFQQLRNFVLRLNVILTLLQTIAIVLAYEPAYYHGPDTTSTFASINIFCTLVFTVDMIVRFLTSPEGWRYAFSLLNIVEVLGVLPFWIDMSGVLWPGVSHWLLILRVSRLIRWLLYIEEFEIIANTISESTEVITLFLMVAVVALPTVGTAVYYSERGAQYPNVTGELWVRPCDEFEKCAKEESPFQYASDGMWLVITTITTLGYGDLTPNSTFGKVISGCCMCIGVLVLAFPVMILSVNYMGEFEKIRRRDIRNAGKRCAHIQTLQREYARVLDQDVKKARKSFVHRESIANFGDMLLAPPRTKPIFFTTPDDGKMRKALFYSATEVRYEPLLILKKNYNQVIVLDQNKRRRTEFRFKIALGSDAASRECHTTMKNLLSEDAPRIARCRHFHVTRVCFALEVPKDDGDFMKSLRLLRAQDDQIEPTRMEVDGTIELYGLANVDENHVNEVAAALCRCRLKITAFVVRTEPTHYEIPFFFEMLSSTSLALVLRSRKDRTGLVYATAAQVTNLIYGIHHLFQLPLEVDCDEEVQIINLAEVNQTITNAILRECAVELDSVDPERMKQFLHPVYEENDETGKKNKWYGLIPFKISGRSEKGAYLDSMFGFALGTKTKEEEEDARAMKMLCSVVVKAVRVSQLTRIEQM